MNDIRLEILMTLIKNSKVMTLSEIANKLKIPHQLVSYHLPILENMGLIIKDGQKYFCQPAFIDKALQVKMLEKLGEITPEFAKSLYLDESETKEDKENILVNCLQIQMMLIIQNMQKIFSEEDL